MLKTSWKLVVVQSAAIVLVCLCVYESAAQQPRQPRIEERQAALRGMKRESAKPRPLTEAEWQQVAIDFKEFQLAVNKLHSTMKGLPLDYRVVNAGAGEIVKRAENLKRILRLVDPEDQTQIEVKATTPDELRSLFKQLITRVDAFLENPMFGNVHVFNVQHAEDAGVELASVVILSQNIRKAAKTLSKTATPKED